MQHVAIMNPAWKLTSKIISGEKTIESRWYKNKSAPWGKIKAGETVYFKDSGKKIQIMAQIKGIEQFENLIPKKVKEILDEYGAAVGITKNQIALYYNLFKDKKYCILIFLNKVQKVPPFQINKKGFGAMSAWICVENIATILNNAD